MRKYLKKILKYFLLSISSLLLLLIIIILILQTNYAQTKLTRYATNKLSDILGTKLEIDQVSISIFDGIVLKGVYLEDKQKRTLAYIKEISVVPKGIIKSGSYIPLHKVKIDSLVFNVYEVDSLHHNLQFLYDLASSEPDTSVSESSGDFRLTCDIFDLTNSYFSYKDYRVPKSKGVNFDDIEIIKLCVSVSGLNIINGDVNIKKIRKISLIDKCSSYKVESLTTDSFRLNSSHILLDNLKIKTPDSDIKFDSLYFKYKKWKSFSKFTKEVYIGANFKDSSYVCIDDIVSFIPEYSSFDKTVVLEGAIAGTVNNVRAYELQIKHEDILFLHFNSVFKNLPNFETFTFDLDVKNLRADLRELGKIKLPGDTSGLFNLPEYFSHIKNINYTGKTKGSVYNFLSKGRLSGNFGKIFIDIVGNRDSLTLFNAIGKFQATNLDIANATDNKDFGRLSFTQDLNFSIFKNKKIKIETKGTIDSISYKNYKYKNVKLYADMYDMKFDSINVIFNQNEIKADINGKIDLRPQHPEFTFTVNVDTANLKRLNIERAYKKSGISFALKADFKGIDIDNFTGNIKLLKNFNYQNDSMRLKVKSFNLNSNYYGQSKEVKKTTIKSDIFDAELIQTGKLSHIVESATELLSGFLPTLIRHIPDSTEHLEEHVDNLRFNINIKKPKQLTSIFMPSLNMSENTKISGYYDINKNSLDIKMNSGNCKFNNIIFEDFYVKAKSKDKTLLFNTGCSSLKPYKNIVFKNFIISSSIKNDSIDFNICWDNKKDTGNYSADINGLIVPAKEENRKKPVIKCKIKNSNIVSEGSVWSFKDAEIVVDSSAVNIYNLAFKNNTEIISIDGNISEYEGDFLTIDFKNFKLSNLKTVIGNNVELTGLLNSNTRLVQLYADPLFFTNNVIKDLKINGVNFGDLYADSYWEAGKIGFGIYTLSGRNKLMTDTIGGYYWPDKDSIALSVEMKGFKVRTLENYYKDYIGTNRGAQLWGKIDVFGNIKSPQFFGDIRLTNTRLDINYLNTKYFINESMKFSVDNKAITIHNTKLYSAKKSGHAFISGVIKHNNFKTFDMDILLNAQNFQLLNTFPTDSSYFYGTAYGTGDISIKGPFDNILIDINLKTGNKTALYIPLASSETLSEENDFINFTNDSIIIVKNNKEEEDIEKKEIHTYTTNMSGMQVNLNLQMTPGAEIQIIMDEKGEDVIKAGGTGNMKIEINQHGDFTMYGDYAIAKGDYLFNLSNIISKKFAIKKNGSLKWYGDPTDALIDIEAVYSLKKVSLYNLLLDKEKKTAKTPVECVIRMQGNLMNPDVTFGVRIPSKYEDVTQQINSLEQDDINKQFLSLLIVGTFQPLPGLSQEGVGGTPAYAGEVLTNKLNSMLSEINENIDIGLNYQFGDQLTSDEVEVALSTQLWNDRVTINGNVGVGGKAKDKNIQNSSNVVGEVEVEVKLNKQGSIRMKVFNEANDELTYDKGQYTQGIGFFWRKEFDRLWTRKKKDKKKGKEKDKNKKTDDEAINKDAVIKEE